MDSEETTEGHSPRKRPREELAAVVLAAGAGRRLSPLTDFLPKALCPLNNVALVDLAIQRAASQTDAIAVNVHYGRTAMEKHLRGRVHLSIEEPEPLGTAGAVAALKDWIDGRAVLVLNADSWHPVSLDLLLEGWDGRKVRLLTVRDPSRGDFGDHRFVGASLMPWNRVQELTTEPSGLFDVCWAPLLKEAHLELVESSPPFFDCGTPADYLAANMAASGGKSVIGSGAVVEGQLIRSVVWPRGQVRKEERLVDSIRIGSNVTVCPKSSL